MGFFELFMVAVGLSMDAFAVAVCKGLSMPRANWKRAGLIALLFGGFQMLMPLLGWLIGSRFEAHITAVDHWIAFILLAYIGGKMIWEARDSSSEETPKASDRSDIKELLILAVSTSIDALAMGITFAFLAVSILPAAGLIGVTTFILSFAGVFLGNKFGAKLMKRAEIGGGIILILIGIKILLEHLLGA